MATNLEVIKDALRLLGVIAETQTPSPEQGEHGLRRLNQMMESWTESDINIGYFEQDSTVDDCPLPAWAVRGVVAKLAQDLKATYPASSLDPSVLDDSQNGYGVILRRSVAENMEVADMTHLPQGTARLTVHSIELDE